MQAPAPPLQPETLDPNRPHGLSDVIERWNVQRHDPMSWGDICRVRAYLGETTWRRARQRIGNDYSLAQQILFHLEAVEQASKALAPYMSIACSWHDAATIGEPCGRHTSAFGYDDDFGLPTSPVVCSRRVLAKHDRLAAMELFKRPREQVEKQPGTFRSVLPLAGHVSDEGVAIMRVQYRQPPPFAAERLFILKGHDWTILDMHIDGKSILAPHLDLPGLVFGNDVLEPHVPLPIIKQDQWIEIKALHVRGTPAGFFGTLVGFQPRGARGA